jgi:RNA polymerase sigma factor (TIGR02999 family)
MRDLSTLFADARAGDQKAIGQIFALLYPDLKAIARSRLRRNQRLTMLDTTVLVHESFLRFEKLGQVALADRQHFLAYAARVIRNVIVDIVRHEHADKRGGGAAMQTLDTGFMEGIEDDRQEVLAVAEALETLEAMDVRLASVVEMRYFAGFTEDEIAIALGVTTRTVRRDWEKARTLLAVALQR